MAVSAQRILETLQDRLNALTGGKAVSGDTDLVGDLGLDSLQVMELLMEMEDAFDISIPTRAAVAAVSRTALRSKKPGRAGITTMVAAPSSSPICGGSSGATSW